MFPFDKEIYISSLKHACIIAALGFLFILLVWGEIVPEDIIGMTITIPLLAYMIHVIRLF